MLNPIRNSFGPYYFQGVDPDYVYLMNSLSIVNGKSPGHLDHPGTTVQALGALTLRVLHPSMSNEELTRIVIVNSEYYMRAIALVLNTFLAALLAVIGIYSTFYLKNILLGILIQVIPFCSSMAWYYVMRITPDLLTLVAGGCFAVLLLRENFYEKEKYNNFFLPIVYGILGGFLVVSKISSAPLLLVPFYIFSKNKRQFFLFTLFLGVAAFLFALPIFFDQWRTNISYIRNWVNELFSIGTHRVASSSSSQINYSKLFEIFKILFFEAPLVPMGILFAALLSYRIKNKLSLIVLLTLVLQLLIVALRPSGKYLFPVFGIAAWSCVYWLNYTIVPRAKKVVPFIFVVVVFIAVFPPFLRLPIRSSIKNEVNDIKITEKKAIELNCSRVLTSYGNFLSAYSELHGFYFANSFSRRIFEPTFLDLFPDAIFYNWSSNIFEKINWEPISISDLRAKNQEYCLHMKKETMSQAPKVENLEFREIFTTATGSSLYKIIFK